MQESLQTRCGGNLGAYTFTHISEVPGAVPSPRAILSPSALVLEASKQPLVVQTTILLLEASKGSNEIEDQCQGAERAKDKGKGKGTKPPLEAKDVTKAKNKEADHKARDVAKAKNKEADHKAKDAAKAKNKEADHKAKDTAKAKEAEARQRKQMLRLKKLILRPRTPLPPSRSRKKLLLLLQRPRLNT